MLPAETPRNKDLPLAVALYCALVAYFLPVHLHDIDPDGISYILLAQKYARGDLWQAVNATWQPLFVWLLTPFMALKIPPLPAGYLLQTACGVLVLCAGRRLALKMPLEPIPIGVFTVTLIAPVLFFTFVLLTPDLLFTALALFYFSVVLDPAYPSGRLPVMAGLFAGLAFLAKAYALPFFLAHFALINTAKGWRTGSWKRSASAFLAGTAVFSLVIAPWVTLISVKYHKFTLSAAYGLNLSASRSGKNSVPPGFYAPPDNTAVSVWQDPSGIAFPVQRLGGMEFLKREAKTVLDNFRTAFGVLDRFSPVAIALLIFGFVFSGASSKALVASAALFIAGFLPVNMEARYIWPALVLLVILAFVLAARVLREAPVPLQKNAALLLLSFSFIAWPLAKMEFEVPRFDRLQKICDNLRAQGVKGRIASSAAWIDSLYIAYFIDAVYYGKRPAEMPEEELRRQLARNRIDYYFVWQPGPVPSFLRGHREIDVGRIQGLRVFKVAGGQG